MPLSTGDAGGEFTTRSIQLALQRERVLSLPPIHFDRNEEGWAVVERELRTYAYCAEHEVPRRLWDEQWARVVLGISASRLRSLQRANLAPFLKSGQEFGPGDLKLLARRAFGPKPS